MIRTVKRASHHNKGNPICKKVLAEQAVRTVMQIKAVIRHENAKHKPKICNPNPNYQSNKGQKK